MKVEIHKQVLEISRGERDDARRGCSEVRQSRLSGFRYISEVICRPCGGMAVRAEGMAEHLGGLLSFGLSN